MTPRRSCSTAVVVDNYAIINTGPARLSPYPWLPWCGRRTSPGCAPIGATPSSPHRKA